MSKAKHGKRNKMLWGVVLAGLLLIIGCYLILPKHQSFRTMQEFSQAWERSDHEARPYMLRWLLNAEPARHKEYQIDQTRLAGMTMKQVESIMPLGRYDQKWEEGGLTYALGSIEPDPFGFIVAKQDHLVIEFDDEGIVVRIKTIS